MASQVGLRGLTSSRGRSLHTGSASCIHLPPRGSSPLTAVDYFSARDAALIQPCPIAHGAATSRHVFLEAAPPRPPSGGAGPFLSHGRDAGGGRRLPRDKHPLF